ncbi:hypothetical protein GMORB2_3415 [Geosmithia morbida]|uniref:Uncharacterized protein n=1 Tax=Geosmithia morbida TaxID=1094350 RepID=A0A9P5D300_9HYPO|nr:uncharacterized protein GMORB2_3415 [Geosmithia morbida]KAF4120004.1 hypothetical protein GMORB2_3415 [Geosmithia morbida]
MRALRQLSRPVLGLRRSMCQKRSFYEAKGHFATINDRGVLVSSETDIYVGDPHEAYVSIMPDLGEAIRACVARQKDMGLAGQQDAKTLPMIFDHATRSFYHASEAGDQTGPSPSEWHLNKRNPYFLGVS